MITPESCESSHATVEPPRDRPLVSVVIPTYNRGPFLKTAIASALRQERAGELFDLELIVVDDCSPDDMSHFATAFPGVRYVRLSENRGASGARNGGIQLAQGKYVALLDDDDEFLTHKLMVQGASPLLIRAVDNREIWASQEPCTKRLVALMKPCRFVKTQTTACGHSRSGRDWS